MTSQATKVSRSRKGRRKRPTREEKAIETRAALLDAAGKVVGRYGYEGASIARITSRAGVAQGTFYNYFEDRQDLLDQLLPIMGREMLDYIRTYCPRDCTGAAREAMRMQAYFSFLESHPWFHRLVNEAETLAPRAHAVYFADISSGYLRSLKRAMERGELKGYTDDDLEPIAYMLLSVRTYLAQRYVYKNGKVKPVPDRVLKTYAEFIRRALFVESDGGTG
ncbi:MAG: TetR/AcrR family transcriptional regulator [Gammaproteobacteria bacterium]|nr:TetR/AcrR family transcriptional regulator [Gammaproteobacteria bacterium]